MDKLKEEQVDEEIRVNKWSDGSHTARVSKDGKVLGVHTRKKYSDLNKEIKSRFGLKGNIPQGEEPGKAKTHQVDEEKGDKITPKVPGVSQKNVQDVAKDLASGQGGATFVPKGSDTRQDRKSVV